VFTVDVNTYYSEGDDKATYKALVTRDWRQRTVNTVDIHGKSRTLVSYIMVISYLAHNIG